jgi:DNA-binding transcriptional LysR family regulator
LREILKNLPVPGLPIHALYLARRYVPARIQLFVDYLAKAFAHDVRLRA